TGSAIGSPPRWLGFSVRPRSFDHFCARRSRWTIPRVVGGIIASFAGASVSPPLPACISPAPSRFATPSSRPACRDEDRSRRRALAIFGGAVARHGDEPRAHIGVELAADRSR